MAADCNTEHNDTLQRGRGSWGPFALFRQLLEILIIYYSAEAEAALADTTALCVSCVTRKLATPYSIQRTL